MLYYLPLFFLVLLYDYHHPFSSRANAAADFAVRVLLIGLIPCLYVVIFRILRAYDLPPYHTMAEIGRIFSMIYFPLSTPFEFVVGHLIKGLVDFLAYCGL